MKYEFDSWVNDKNFVRRSQDKGFELECDSQVGLR